MNLIQIEDLLKNVSNRYELANLAAIRTKQLMDGAASLIKDTNGKRLNIVALEEIKKGKVILQREDSTES